MPNDTNHNRISEPIVEFDGVSLKADRGGYVFRDLSFKINHGESVIIHGTSGSGKTTLAELIVGLRFSHSGRVTVLGSEVRKNRKASLRRIRRHTGGVGGPFGLMPGFTVAENITYPLVLAASRKKLVRERLFRHLSEFSLLKLANKYPSQLTRVESTLVQIARATVADQQLVIIDEPSAGLDPATYGRVFDYLTKIGLAGTSMLMLVSEDPPGRLPESRTLRLVNGVLE